MKRAVPKGIELAPDPRGPGDPPRRRGGDLLGENFLTGERLGDDRLIGERLGDLLGGDLLIGDLLGGERRRSPNPERASATSTTTSWPSICAPSMCLIAFSESSTVSYSMYPRPR